MGCRTRKAAATAGALACVLFCLVVPGVAAADSGCANRAALPDAGNVAKVELASVCLVNGERSARGIPPLAVDPRLGGAARRHSEDMASHGYFGHHGSDGSSLAGRAAAYGYDGKVGENLARAFWSAEAAVAAWMSSPAHRDTLLNPRYTLIGAGVAAQGPHWTHVFGVGAAPPGAITGQEPEHQGPAGAGGAGPGTGAVSSGSAARPVRLTASAPRSRSTRTTRITVTGTAPRGAVVASLTVPARVARRHRLPRRLGRVRIRRTTAGRYRATVRLTSLARSRLRSPSVRRVRAVLTVTAGDQRRSRGIVLRR